MLVKSESSSNSLKVSLLFRSWILAIKLINFSSAAVITGLIISILMNGNEFLPGIIRDKVTLSAETIILEAEKSEETDRPSILSSVALNSVLNPLTS